MIGLSVTLGLLLLAILVAAVFYKREVITDWLSHRRQALKKEPLKESSSQRSSLTDKQRRKVLAKDASQAPDQGLQEQIGLQDHLRTVGAKFIKLLNVLVRSC